MKKILTDTISFLFNVEEGHRVQASCKEQWNKLLQLEGSICRVCYVKCAHFHFSHLTSFLPVCALHRVVVIGSIEVMSASQPEPHDSFQWIDKAHSEEDEDSTHQPPSGQAPGKIAAAWLTDHTYYDYSTEDPSSYQDALSMKSTSNFLMVSDPANAQAIQWQLHGRGK